MRQPSAYYTRGNKSAMSFKSSTNYTFVSVRIPFSLSFPEKAGKLNVIEYNHHTLLVYYITFVEETAIAKSQEQF